ncbi:radical SAM/SPASM domain-containing protein [Lactococcus nasutitermitis]|uniref:Radical SAM/SPASM domain-containing protein n=1 Tax=Lactococcus nasutitermitis TaxID=1652957 RepID=A0ABV9JA39_9LACT|nr:radical SAM protein [Lactococcus nasutitermitis]
MPQELLLSAISQKKLPKSLKNKLVKEYFLVNDNFDEKERLFVPIRNMCRYSTATLHIVVHLNYDCNLKCSYCYQNVISNKMVMSGDTERAVIQFIDKLVEDKNPEYIDLNFIGGEPMLHVDKIKRIMQACNKMSKNFNFSAVSNGTFGNTSQLNELADLGLKEYFITLDGLESEHDRYRKYQNGRGSFSTIIKNIKKMQEKFPEIKVLINSNLNEENKRKVPELLDYLIQQDVLYPVVFSEVIDTAASKFNGTIKDGETSWYDAHKAAIDRGYHYKPYTREIDLACSRNIANYYIIGADGFLFSCIEAVGMNEFRQCHTSDYGTAMFDIIRSQTQDVKYSSKRCNSCEFLPHCDGGCYYRRSMMILIV